MDLSVENSVITCRDNSLNSEWHLSVCCMSDIHRDSSKCDETLFRKHLDEAKRRGSIVLIAGDLFDAMQGRDDPRRSVEELQAQYHTSSYFDALVMDTAEFFLKDYKDLHFIFALGNHETSVLTHNSTNLIDRLVYAMNTQGGHALGGGYYGWLRFMFSRGNSNRKSKKLYWHHGKGTSAVMSFGTLESRRQASYIEADIFLNGHNHQGYYVPLKKITLSDSGRQRADTIHFLRTPGYKFSGIEAEQRHGYDIERHPEPTTRGCIFVGFTIDGKEIGTRIEPWIT